LRIACKALIERFAPGGRKGRPETAIEDIIKNGPGDFDMVFKKFFDKEGVYGFGDIQFRKIYDKVMQYR
jgi:hypothetical protein